MSRSLKVLGNGQIWDLKGILPIAPGKTFEDLFSGRALGQMAREVNQFSSEYRKPFSRFKEKGKITGLSVTKALLSNNQRAKTAATIILKGLAENAVAGIKALNKGKGIKPSWSSRQRGYWRNLEKIIIGGGVSEGQTGKLLVRLIRINLSRKGLLGIQVHQAKFPGKEAGFLGGVINVLRLIRNEAGSRRLKLIAAIGLDLGRADIGVGLLAVNARTGEIVGRNTRRPWIFECSVNTPMRRCLKIFLDARRKYSHKERALGKRIRGLILSQMADLIIQAQSKAKRLGLECSNNIAVAVPGCTCGDYILNSTDYLPFLKRRDGFNFSQALRKLLVSEGIKGNYIHIINDGIAAGIANAYFGLSRKETGKFAFFGVGSGLGGCVGLINNN